MTRAAAKTGAVDSRHAKRRRAAATRRRGRWVSRVPPYGRPRQPLCPRLVHLDTSAIVQARNRGWRRFGSDASSVHGQGRRRMRRTSSQGHLAAPRSPESCCSLSTRARRGSEAAAHRRTLGRAMRRVPRPAQIIKPTALMRRPAPLPSSRLELARRRLALRSRPAMARQHVMLPSMALRSLPTSRQCTRPSPRAVHHVLLGQRSPCWPRLKWFVADGQP